MSKIVIKVENLSKQYRLGNIGTGSIAHDVNRAWYKLRGKEDPYLKIGESNDRTTKGNSDYVWALKDINFDVKQGEVLGIIGRNGAGKSTLLKILSRTTIPTIGSIKIRGRVASLLEVGTGFHPELSGRENIFLNGAIMGMTKNEIKKKFDEIVDFAGVERYIDTPVKRYSSGMYVRLAFGVAAHLEPEILIVDEVLAVGDEEFQKKAMGKIKDVSQKEGRTVLFVSHNMGAIKSLCPRSIYLKNGLVFLDGQTDTVIDNYLTQGIYKSNIFQGVTKSNKKIWFKNILVQNSKGVSTDTFLHDAPISFSFELGFNVLKEDHKYSIFCIILDKNKNRVFAAESPVVTTNNVLLTIDKNSLVRGNYSIHTFIHLAKVEQIDVAEDICQFNVLDNGSTFLIHGDYDYGNVFSKVKWIYN